MFKINIIKKIKLKYWTWQYKKQYKKIEDTYEFIWGIKSEDDLSLSVEANFWTRNDFDIIYNKKNKTYSMSVETIYKFDNGKEGEKKYLKNILHKFTSWMDANGYDTSKELNLWDVFTDGKNIRTEFETIEELYATFKFLVNGYLNQN